MTREEAIKYLKSSGMTNEQIKAISSAFTCDYYDYEAKTCRRSEAPGSGYWIKETISLPLSDSVKECVRCSNCQLHFDYPTNFCPNCGNDKRGRESEEIDEKNKEA